MINRKPNISVRRTRYTYNINARISLEMCERLDNYVSRHGITRTSIIVAALQQYLDEHDPDYVAEGGDEDVITVNV